MQRSTLWRSLFSLGVVLSLVTGVQYSAPSGRAAGTNTSRISVEPLTPLADAEAQQLMQNATQHVVIIMRDQFASLPARGSTRASRMAAIAAEQQPIMAELARLNAPNVHAFSLFNGIAATVSPAEEARLKADASVQSVVPDRVIYPAPLPQRDITTTDPGAAPDATTGSAPCSPTVSLEPEALQLTNTAFGNASGTLDPSRPQAQTLTTGPGAAPISGAGVKVAFFAENIDVNNPDFIRPDGSRVFIGVRDFTGLGPNGPTDAAEAYIDASSIAAQGNVVYPLSNTRSGPNFYLNPAPGTTGGQCNIRIRGMSPGASLVGYNVFPPGSGQYDSVIAQSLEYAVMTDTVDILSESFGGAKLPDNPGNPAINDPVELANDAAVAAGKTVVESTGDAGTANTIGPESTDPNVIAAGATTQFRYYVQTGGFAAYLGNGDYISNNISSISSGGISQDPNNPKTVDVVAGGDLSWALCTPNRALYSSCVDNAGKPATVLGGAGGTSESAPLIAGEAALVIEAYRRTHGGASPSPALVKSIIMSTATDLGAPAYEQGAGQINSLKAVQAALSYTGSSIAPQGNGLVVTPSALSAVSTTATQQTFQVQVTNTGSQPQLVLPGLRTLGSGVQALDAPFYTASFLPSINPTTALTFSNQAGAARPYVTQTFTVPSGAQRLDAAVAWDVAGLPGSLVRLNLFDPQGRVAAYSIPQGVGNGYGHVDVRSPQPGAWTALLSTNPPSSSLAYTGTVHLDVAASRFKTVGTVSPLGRFLPPGGSGTFTVSLPTPAQPGDLSARLVIRAIAPGDLPPAPVGSFPAGSTYQILRLAPALNQLCQLPVASEQPNRNPLVERLCAGTSVPISLRSLVPLGPTGGTFSGIFTGGNGRSGEPNNIQTYPFDVPAGQRDLDVSIAMTDTNTHLTGALVDPSGQPIDLQDTATDQDQNGNPTANTNTLQFFRRDPQPGRWRVVLEVNFNTSGQQTALPFNATIGFNAAFNGVQASGVPNGPGATIPQNTTATATIRVTNNGNTTKDFFVDPRLTRVVPLNIVATRVVTAQIPSKNIPAGIFAYVLPETSAVVATAESMSPTVPIRLEIANVNGEAPAGGTGSQDIASGPSVRNARGNYTATVQYAPGTEVVPGFAQLIPSQIGPFAGPTGPTTITVVGTEFTQLPDFTVTSSTGDAHLAVPGFVSPSSYNPLTLAPGQTGTITVTFSPTANSGTPVSGNLYVDAFNVNSTGLNLITGSADELIAIPYQY